MLIKTDKIDNFHKHTSIQKHRDLIIKNHLILDQACMIKKLKTNRWKHSIKKSLRDKNKTVKHIEKPYSV